MTNLSDSPQQQKTKTEGQKVDNQPDNKELGNLKVSWYVPGVGTVIPGDSRPTGYEKPQKPVA